MQRRLLSMLFIFSLLLIGCVEEDSSLSSAGNILAVLENNETRTSVTDEGKFTWSKADEVWLNTTNGGIVGTLSSGAGTSKAMFSYGSFVGDLTGKAVYPYNANHSIAGDVLSVMIPASYDLGTSIANTNAVMYGEKSGDDIMFTHLAGVMRFVFKNVPAGTNRFSITMDKKINGVFEVDLAEEYPIIKTEETSAESERTVTLNFNAITGTSDIVLYVPLPVGTYNTLELSLMADSNLVWEYSNTVTNTIGRKTLKLMPAVTIGGSIGGEIEGGENPSEPNPDSYADLSVYGTANSYIVSQQGTYKFKTVKGNSSESVGSVASVVVLWESFGTAVVPSVGDLIRSVSYKSGEITFKTADSFQEGNAVIAAKDASGTILWSWHIWLTDEPQRQVYYNDAGTMMDRNLGATSATPGEGTLGLMYQWGRKDPFLGGQSIDNYYKKAESTATWMDVGSTSYTGTIEYAVANPTTFINGNSNNNDWYYTGSDSHELSRWPTSSSSKSVYDPCPPGWRVPDGGQNGIWSKAYDKSLQTSTLSHSFDQTNKGMNFSGIFGSDTTIWYPAAGNLLDEVFNLANVGSQGHYWSAGNVEGVNRMHSFSINNSHTVGLWASSFALAAGYSVRCSAE